MSDKDERPRFAGPSDDELAALDRVDDLLDNDELTALDRLDAPDHEVDSGDVDAPFTGDDEEDVRGGPVGDDISRHRQDEDG